MSKSQLKDTKLVKRKIKFIIDPYNNLIFKFSRLSSKRFHDKYQYYNIIFPIWKELWLFWNFFISKKDVFLIENINYLVLKRKVNIIQFKKYFLKKKKTTILRTNIIKHKVKKQIKILYKLLENLNKDLTLLKLSKKHFTFIKISGNICKNREISQFNYKIFKFSKIFFHVSEGEKSVSLRGSLTIRNINSNLYFLSNKLYLIKINYINLFSQIYNQYSLMDINSLQNIINYFQNKYLIEDINIDELNIKQENGFNINILDTKKKQLFDFETKLKAKTKWRTKDKFFCLYTNLTQHLQCFNYYFKLKSNNMKLKNLIWYDFFNRRVELIIYQSNLIDNMYFLQYLLKNNIFFVNNITINSKTYLIKQNDCIILNSKFKYLIYKLILKKLEYNFWYLIWYLFIFLDKQLFSNIINVKNNLQVIKKLNINYKVLYKYLFFKNAPSNNLEINYKLLAIWILFIQKNNITFNNVLESF